VFAADLRELDVLRYKLELQRQRVLLESQELVERIKPDYLQELDIWNLNAEDVAHQLRAAILDGVTINSTIPEYRTAIFEGAQGVLLDEYRGFHPHTTWSTVTPYHAWELIRQLDIEAVAVLGVTRAYTTRHGEGPLPTYDAELTARLRDSGNPWNRWQGSLRCGWLDLPLLRYAAAVVGPLDGIVVNHLDQIRATEYHVCEAYQNTSLSPAAAPSIAWQNRMNQQLHEAEPVLSPATPEIILDSVSAIAPVIVTSTGPTHSGRSSMKLPFRLRRPSG
jgi:adenylosuccinate synthase